MRVANITRSAGAGPGRDWGRYLLPPQGNQTSHDYISQFARRDHSLRGLAARGAEPGPRTETHLAFPVAPGNSKGVACSWEPPPTATHYLSCETKAAGPRDSFGRGGISVGSTTVYRNYRLFQDGFHAGFARRFAMAIGRISTTGL